MPSIRSRVLAAFAAGALFVAAAPAGAQAWHYAAFQPADVTPTEFNFIISGFGDYGTSFVGQYRWAADKRVQFWGDLGVATASGETAFLIGLAGGYSFMTPTKDKPIDVMGTLGLYGAFSSKVSIVRVPIGVDVGHTFKLDNGHPLNIFVHPRLSVDICASKCSGTNANLNFDLGAGYAFTKDLVGRAAFTFGGIGGGNDQGGFGVSLALKTN